MTEVPAFFWGAIVPLALQGVILLAAAAIVDRLLPRRVWPELRLAAGTILLVKLVLPPRLASPLAWTHPLAADALMLPPPASHRAWAITLGWTWAAGVLVALALLAVATRRLHVQWSRADQAPPAIVAAAGRAARRLGIRRVPAVRLLAGAETPFVFGPSSSRIVLPAGISEDEIEHALLHELAHVRRHDVVAATLVTLIRAVFWFHPFVHAAARRLAGLREICCDRTVARALGDEAESYRGTLLRLAKRRHREALALPMIGGAGIVARLCALEMIERDRPRLRAALTMVAACLALACALPLAPAAESRAAATAELVTRPPGCLQLHYMVLGRLAEEQRRQSSTSEKR